MTCLSDLCFLSPVSKNICHLALHMIRMATVLRKLLLHAIFSASLD